MFPNSLTERLGLSLPIIQAPMAGGATTPELVAAVANAGGLGSLGASFMSGKAIAAACDKVKARTNKGYGVNLFVPEDHRPDLAVLRHASAALDGYRAEVGLAPPPEKAAYLQPFEEQLDATLAARPQVFSFCFGIPDDAILDRVRTTDAYIIGTATTVAEAVLLEEAGVDAIVAQGFEAGGHRSTFAVPHDHAFIGLMALLPQIVDAVELPVIAAGGIMDGRGIAAALALGASAAQLGTAFLATEESGWGEVQRQALLASRDDSTAITDVFTGKPARGLRNRFMVEAFDKHLPRAPYPAQHGLTSDLRRAAAEQGRADLMAIWAGQGVGAIRRAATADLMQRLRDELVQALQATSGAVASLNGRTHGRR